MANTRKNNPHNLPSRCRVRGKKVYYRDQSKGGKDFLLGYLEDRATWLKNYERIREADKQRELSTIYGLADEYREMLNDPRNPLNLADKTRHEYLRQLNPQGWLLGIFGRVPVFMLQKKDIIQAVEAHPHKKSAKRQVSLLSNLVKLGIYKGVCSENPCKEIFQYCFGAKKELREVSRSRYITDEEFLLVYDAASIQIRIAMSVAYLTGARLSNVLAIKVSDYNEDFLLIDETKTRTKARHGMTKELWTALEMHRQIKSLGNHVIRNRRGQPYTLSGFEANWQRLKWKVLRGRENFTFHDIRHKAATDATEIDMNAQYLLGHSHQAMTDRYINHPQGRLVKGILRLPTKK